MASTDPFMDVAKGRFPISENTGAARYWTIGDGVPRPNCEYWLLTVLAIVLGVIGADHFYLRSPKTGFLKMITMGGFGLWWLWDIAQILTEKERVVAYGMSTPFDLTTGIGQGMITDQDTNYKSKSSYSLWSWSTIFGLFGFDSFFVMKNNGQGARKLMEGMITLASIGALLSVVIVGLPSGFFAKIGALISAGLAVLGLFFFGTMVGVSWYKTLMKSLSPPEKLFTEGLVFTEQDDKQLNSLVNWLVGNLDMPDERKEQIISDIKYGSIPPEKMGDLFKVFHASELKPDMPSSNNNTGNPGSMPSFLAYATAPISIFWYWVRLTASSIIKTTARAAIPGGAAIEVAANLGAKVLEEQINTNPAVMEAASEGITSLVPGVLGKALKAATSGKGLSAIAQGAVQDVVGQAQGAVAGKAAEMVGTAVNATKVLGEAASTVNDLGEVAGAAMNATKVLGKVTGTGGEVASTAMNATKVVGEATGTVKGLGEVAGAAMNATKGLSSAPSEKSKRLAEIIRGIRELIPTMNDKANAQLANQLYSLKPDITKPEMSGMLDRFIAMQKLQAQPQPNNSMMPESDAAYKSEMLQKQMQQMPRAVMAGGARAEPLSLEGKLMGAATIALIGGGAVKFIIDNLMPE
jgi:hypothetical protein